MRIVFFLLTLSCVALAAAIKKDAIKEYKEGNRNFTAGLYKELIKVKTGNIAVSPFTARTILALTHEGARGETATEMLTALFLPDTNEKIQVAFEFFLPELNISNDDVKLSTANKIYVAQDVKLEDDFKQVAVDVYESDVEDIDFNDNVAAAERINGWVEDRTDDRIKDLIDPNTIDTDTKVLLVNTLHFKGTWTYPFPEQSTTRKKFHKSKDTTVDVDMMHQSEYLWYYESSALNAKFLKLDYRVSEDEISMVFILPNEIDGLSSLEQNMKDVLAQQPLTQEHVVVEIPKFRIKTHIRMKPILEKLGIRKIFNEDEADLSGISSTTPNLSISEVVQKVFIDVGENGTEAASATAELLGDTTSIGDTIGGNTTSAQQNKQKRNGTATSFSSAIHNNEPPKYFVADHPFMYFVQCNRVILFAGRYIE